MRRLALMMALLAAAAVSCVGGGHVGGGNTNTGGGGNSGGELNPAVTPGAQALPALPVTHGGSTIPEVWIFGKDTYQRSAGAVEQDTALRLEPSTPTSHEWAMYRISLTHALGSLRVRLDAAEGGAYVGLSDYSKGGWEFKGPYSADAVILPCDGKRYESPTGAVYCLVMAAGKAVTVKQVVARTVFGDPVMVTTELGQSTRSLREPALALVGGIPVISYSCECLIPHADDFYNVRYLRAQSADGATWPAPVEVKPGVQVFADTVSMKETEGCPAIVWCWPTEALWFVRALDASGSTWTEPLEVDSYASLPSLALIDGAPAISYDGRGGSLQYVRALDADGSSWGTPVTLMWEGYWTGFSCLAEVDGCAAMSYITNGPGGCQGAYYIRALDPTGGTWGAPAVADPGGSRHTSLTVVSGKPAIACNGSDQHPGLHYVQALDSDGNAWGTPIVLDSDGDFWSKVCLAVVGGNPAVVYTSHYTQGEEELCVVRYVRALDADGKAWDTPVVVDRGGCGSDSLIAVNSKPAVCYLAPRETGWSSWLELRYVRAF